ncbi:MAG TPA: 4'-phosphopantetheinyl transferase [Cyanobacteria bacterium UBA8803]|nr:4'-phosphopantetheinyl transferase [Cyanobacteria bacterium UBA9273]HBL62810.1 4'-phosphopantetheinyl transferase [Cyanobacteria bacterium UBA8803]
MQSFWHFPPPDLVLSANEVHVWRAELEQPTWQIEKLAQTLSPDEKQRANRFYFERDRKKFIVGRGILRMLLSSYSDIDPSRLQFSYSPRGKPAIANTDPKARLEFNLSHSNGLVLYAISRDLQLGIDLEYIRPMQDAEQLAKRFFSPREYVLISSLPDEQKQEAFFNGWTRKEAYLKATGDGLAGLAQVEVSLMPGDSAMLVSISGDASAASRWDLYHLIPAPDYVAALAVAGKSGHLELLDISALGENCRIITSPP